MPLVRRSLLLALLALLGVAASAQAAALPGVQAHLLWGDVTAAETRAQLDAARDVGAKIVRVDTGWGSWEQQRKGDRNAWYLGRMDTVVAEAEARGLKVLFTVWQTPCWASSAPETLKQGCAGAWWDRGVSLYPPSNPDDYADAMRFIVDRYGTRVAGYEVWNEPNSPDYFKATDPVGAYTRLLRAAYPAAKAANAGATVVGGSLMWADFGFTDRVMAAGGKGHFDAWSIHPYSDDRSPLDPANERYLHGSFVRGIPAVHDVLVRHGAQRPLWLTEFGWSTTAVRGAANWLNGVDEPVQAQFMGDALRALAAMPFVAVGISYTIKDMGTDPMSTIQHFGLMAADGRRKPAFAAFRAAAGELVAGTAVAPAPVAAAPVVGLTGAEARERPSLQEIGEAYSVSGGRSLPVQVKKLKGGAGYRLTGRARPGVTVRVTVRPGPSARTLRLVLRADKRGRFTGVLRTKQPVRRSVVHAAAA